MMTGSIRMRAEKRAGKTQAPSALCFEGNQISKELENLYERMTVH